MLEPGRRRIGCRARQPKDQGTSHDPENRNCLAPAAALCLLLDGAALACTGDPRRPTSMVRSGARAHQFPVVGSFRAVETVDVWEAAPVSWCRVRFGGGSGFASRSYLAMGGGAPRRVVARRRTSMTNRTTAMATTITATTTGRQPYIYANPRFRHRHGWNGRPGWNGGGNWAVATAGRGRRLRRRSPVSRQRLCGTSANWQRRGTGIGRRCQRRRR
jgi:uncharacterized protein YraI